MSRRRKGSKNRDKARRKVAIQHGKVARSRRDHHHKEALTLVRENQVIYVEDLNIAGWFAIVPLDARSAMLAGHSS